MPPTRPIPRLALVLALIGGAPATACDAPRPATNSPAVVDAAPAPAPLPARLRDTGLYVDGSTRTVDPRHLAFSPQYPLWTDGATKRRWISLPAGTWIDASDPDAWRFPPGTRLWKEFAFDGRPVETRYMEALPDGTWRYATYLWRGDDATLAPEGGVPAGVPVGGATTTRHWIPAEPDCRACHEGRPSPVLGFEWLQLSPDRDPGALHAGARRADDVDLAMLVERGLVRGLPASPVVPRIDAPSPTARAALGYLHGNCGGCHNDQGPLAPLGLVLAHTHDGGAAAVLASTVERSSRFRAADHPDATVRIAPGDPDRSVLALRLRAHDPHVRMPPIGTLVVDDAAVSLIERWIAEDLREGAPGAHNPSSQEHAP